EERADGRMPVREIVGVDQRVREEFSSRRADIEAAYAALLEDYRAAHGRDPDKAMQYRLAQQATLDTRGPKQDPQPLRQRVQQWRSRAAEVLGDQEAVAAMVDATMDTQAPKHVPDVDAAELVEDVVQALTDRRATWNQWHVRAEVQRVMRTLPVPVAEAAEMEQAITDAVLADSVRLTPHEANPAPESLSREDGA